MKTLLRCLMGIICLATINGCATTKNIGYTIDNLLVVRTTPAGAQVEVHPNIQERIVPFRRRPQLFQQLPWNLGGGWPEVTGFYNLEIPYRNDRANFRVQPYGAVADVWYRYDNNGRPLYEPLWQFDIPNHGDEGWHFLVIYLRYTDGVVDSSVYRVRNHAMW